MHPPYLLLSLFPSVALTCSPLNPRQSSRSFPITTPGPPISPPPSTAGYLLNHAALNVHNLSRSINWYGDVFGFQLLFTHRISPRYTVAYLAHSARGGNATWPQTVDELTAEMMSGRARGLLELLHFDYGADPGPSRGQWFGHLGLIVPDVGEAQVRSEGLGAEVIKRVGEAVDWDGPVGDGYGEGFQERYPEDAELIEGALLNVLLVLDPDGNRVEVQALGG
ncbi:Glyoxalase/Bleomycin resistance protein/Dihydroxybiphenyl dioxygenase [Immersiella caudata]|uniref:Glyoxalase/Bleomycin resistance protein/Dihydroxybiphenyl dioxygenase n=1 Tax=Immersiella caudata TaxID=314043 RepID=A0AA40BWX2_9PEZI|nr:Glyoxalase/Bleomycin resistance protein/Dihydroxybiphenyl dioxygenase [Immersiella caudata]